MTQPARISVASISQAARPAVFLLALSLLEGSTLLVHDLLPNIPAPALPPLERSAITLGSFGLLAAAAAFFFRQLRLSATNLRLAVITGLTLFAIPQSLAAVAANYISPLTVAALETLALLFCVILDPYIASPQHDQHPRYGTLAALLAFSGVLFIFPVSVPTSWQQALGFIAALLAALSLGAGSSLAVRIASSPPSLAISAATASVSAAIALALLSSLIESPRSPAFLLSTPAIELFLIQLFALTLFFWLTRRLRASQLATRAIWILLIPILIEIAILPVSLSTQSWIGFALMLFGASALLFSGKDPAPPRSSFLR